MLGTPYETGLSGTARPCSRAARSRSTNAATRWSAASSRFLDERRIVPSFDLRLNTTAGNYDVTLAVTGEPGDTETTLTSDPSLPEPDIMALLVTGRTLDEMRGEEYDVAREQVLSYLAGRVGSRLGRGLERATGLSEVRVEPQSHRATKPTRAPGSPSGQELTDDLKLVYSTDLADSNDQIWVAEYDVTRRFQTNAVRQSDSSYRIDFRHDVRFGGRRIRRAGSRARGRRSALGHGDRRRRASGRPRSASVSKFEEGDAFDFFKARDAAWPTSRSALQERGYLQSRVRLDRPQDGDTASRSRSRVTSGPVVELAFDGVQPARQGCTRKSVAQVAPRRLRLAARRTTRSRRCARG